MSYSFPIRARRAAAATVWQYVEKVTHRLLLRQASALRERNSELHVIAGQRLSPGYPHDTRQLMRHCGATGRIQNRSLENYEEILRSGLGSSYDECRHFYALRKY